MCHSGGRITQHINQAMNFILSQTWIYVIQYHFVAFFFHLFNLLCVRYLQISKEVTLMKVTTIF